MKRALAFALLLLAGCATTTTVPPVQITRQVDDVWREIHSILDANQDVLAQEYGAMRAFSDPFIFDLADVVQVVTGFGLDAEFAYVWTHPDVDGPEYQACAAAMTGIQSEWENVLLHTPAPGWSSVPPVRITEGWISWNTSAKYLYTVTLPQTAIFGTGSRYYDVGDLDVDDVGNLWIRCKGGIIQLDIPPDPGLAPSVYLDNPAACPVASTVGVAVVDTEITALADPAKSFGGFAVRRGRAWFASYENYNVAGRDNSTVTSCLLDMSDARGPWRVGPANFDVPLVDAFHANKVSGGMGLLPSWWGLKHAGGRELYVWDQRPAGAFGGDFGPGCYALYANELTPAGTDLGGLLCMVYPKTLWSPIYKNGENRLYACEQFIDDGVNRASLIVPWMKGLGPNNYGPAQGCPGNTDKGWNSQPYEPRIYVYSGVDLGDAAEGKVKPWQIQPVEEVRPTFVWQDPIHGFDGDCKRPYIVGAAWKLVSPNRGLLYLLQLKAYQVNGGNPLPVIHVVEFAL